MPTWDSQIFVYNLGVSNNSKTYITRPDNYSVNVYESHEPLHCTDMEEFWLSWANETVRLGSGRQLGRGEFIRLNDSVPTSKNFLAISTGFGASGYWILQSGKILLHIDVNSRPALTLAKMLETLLHNSAATSGMYDQQRLRPACVYAQSDQSKKEGNIRNLYNQAPHLTQITNGKVTTS